MFKRSVLTLSLLMLLLSAATTEAGTGGKIEWKTNYDEALKMAKQTGKPIMLDFWATWCGPCKTMDASVWPNQEVVTLSQKFVCVKVDIDVNPNLAGFYRANSIPTMVFVDPWGNELNRHTGLLRPKDLANMMEVMPADFSEIAEASTILEKDSNNTQALSNIAGFYGKIGAFDMSNRYYERALKTDAAKKEGELREGLLLGIGLNQLKMKKYSDARKTFERCLKECPEGTRCDMVLLGIVTSNIFQGKKGDAEKAFEQLKSRYPDSSATQMAAQNLQQMKN
jgi:thiol-disulfide isomerase/thioredoxin